MNIEESSSHKRKRYIPKINTSYEDIKGMIEDIEQFKDLIKSKYSSSTYRTRILESNQTLVDMLKRQEKRLKPIIDNEKSENNSLIKRIQFLENKLEQIEAEQFSINLYNEFH